ncbi:hypothetical protein CHLNCDRAFT_142950 [Chlorella variabilis]|uniref:Protein kinase domain-containing protein n=1 Tax=Chlorella variabilis TaxID=554065 RepID=E1Z953_CHLVA|nr:hypothetical protein CHLNCDRAFT_142950 [Chlorella variabilis]EFN57457.1 hypothetical protein CHLNCDRAFT_142950 [Chlorella variabilis]|eukprot:XP_005849559.1 hypothetical protein CHLNCDRAFT_142950 [Chlorella variabilis]
MQPGQPQDPPPDDLMGGHANYAMPAPREDQQAAEVDDYLEGHPRYKQIRFLNRGAYGFVILALDNQTGEQVALKFIKRGPQHITKYVDREVFLTKTHLVLAMEYAAGGDLFRYVSARRGLPEDEARWFFQQLMVAVDYCHRMGVTSRDIKLENTLLDGGQWPLIKLADFGFSKDPKQQSEAKTRVGTPAYLAPEVIAAQPGKSYDAQKVDIWSCGVLLYVMVVGRYPFGMPSDAALDPMRRLSRMMERTMKAEFSFPPDKPLSDGVKDLISRILVQDPALRPSLHDIQAHPWFMQGLEPGALNFNDAIVQESLANQPTAEMLAEVHSIVEEALQEVPSLTGLGQQPNGPDQLQQSGGEDGGPHLMMESEELSSYLTSSLSPRRMQM